MSPINFATLYPAICSISIAGNDVPVWREICSLSLLIVSIDEANCGNPCNCRNNHIFSVKIAIFSMVRKSFAHIHLNFAVNMDGKPPRTDKADMRFQFTREGFAVVVNTELYDNYRKNDIG
ncbi:hypothetical protein [Muribaculum intestinale]|jgi:hypothetical protein|uniref:hypothetical protein n=2 Tax=Muribaculum intestinale TaxID=1796646 RepID=UPI0025B1D465|nr:hypothetical protein [Muribaculum intestinale]